MIQEELIFFDKNQIFDSKLFKVKLNNMINIIQNENLNNSKLFYSKWKTVHLLGILINTNFLNEDHYIKILKNISIKGLDCTDIKSLMKYLPIPLGYNYVENLDNYLIDKGEDIYVKKSLATN